MYHLFQGFEHGLAQLAVTSLSAGSRDQAHEVAVAVAAGEEFEKLAA